MKSFRKLNKIQSTQLRGSVLGPTILVVGTCAPVVVVSTSFIALYILKEIHGNKKNENVK
jgi:hypothetical protein